MKRELWIAVDRLPGNLPKVIQRRYIDGWSLDKVSKVFGVTCNGVRQLQNKAMRALRQPGLSQKYRKYYEEYISAESYHHVGVESFMRTGLSEVELEVLGWIRWKTTKGIRTRRPAEQLGMSPGERGGDKMKCPKPSPTDWKRIGHFKSVQNIPCDTGMILKVCVKYTNRWNMRILLRNLNYKYWNNYKKSKIWLDKDSDICYTKNDVWLYNITFWGDVC